MDIRAAVVQSFGTPPRYEPFGLPAPADEDQELVDVLAVGLHPRVRTGAAGSHYTSTGKLPMVPGVDGVGRWADGRLVYFVADDDLVGPMATRTVIDSRRSIPLPDGADVVKIAAAMNPAMSSWVALRRRVPIEAGQSVLILGATGNAGQMAVQVAKRLGAGRVVGAGRDRDRLAALPGIGADATVALTDDADATAAELAKEAAEVDLVVDYLWGRPMRRRDHGPAAGPRRPQPRPELDPDRVHGRAHHRAPVSGTAFGELPAPGQRSGRGVHQDVSGGTPVPGRGDRERRHRGHRSAGPLAEVESAWNAPEVPGVRTVLVP